MTPPSRTLVLAVVSLMGSACVGSPDSGTAVGNPGNLVFTASAPDDGTVDVAEARIVEVRASTCDGTLTERLIVDDIFDLLTIDNTVEIPSGSYCTLDVELDTETPIHIEGSTASGTAYSAVLDPGILLFDSPFTVDGGQIEVALPISDYVPEEAIDEDGPDTSYEKDDPESSTWAEDVRLGAELRQDGSPVPDNGSSADGGCSCSQNQGPLWWGSLPLALLMLRRRYQGSEPSSLSC